MSFCKFSTEYIAQNSTSVDNLFINAFLPYAPDVCVKVYLYGLSKCYCADSFDNTLERFSKVLNLSEEDIEQVFLYWQELGLVQIIATEPFEVKYIPVKSAISKSKKFSEDKYAEFNAQVENMIKGRMPSPNEFFEYYNVIETMHIEIPAMISIIKYCTMVKGESVGYPYIIAVAGNVGQMDELEGLGLRWLRLNFTTENSKEIESVIKAYQSGEGSMPDRATRGLYYRGVQ